MENVRLSSALGGAVVTAGMKLSAPSGTSVPLFARGVILDNIAGPGLELMNILDVVLSDGWINSAAGGPCVRMTRGGNLRFTGNDFRGGGSPLKTFDFEGGATDGFVSVGNECPTNWLYYLPATGKPKKMLVDDLTFTDLPLEVSNDMAGLRAARVPRLGTRWLADETRFGGVGSGLTILKKGTATLASGTVTVSEPLANATTTAVLLSATCTRTACCGASQMREWRMARNSVMRVRSVAMMALKHAQRRDMVARNAAELAEMPAGTGAPDEGRSLTLEEAASLLTAIQLPGNNAARPK